MDINNVPYTADYDMEWQEGLNKCRCLQDLKNLVEEFRPLVESAAKIVNNMTTEAQFKAFKSNLKKERKGEWCCDDAAAMILIPTPMMHISMVAFNFHVPFGCAFNRMKDLGMLHIAEGKVVLCK